MLEFATVDVDGLFAASRYRRIFQIIPNLQTWTLRPVFQT